MSTNIETDDSPCVGNCPEACVLLVDDDSLLLRSLTRSLRRWGFRKILAAGCGDDALEVMGEFPVGVVISDFQMPGMNGVELLRAVGRRYPRTVRFMLSGSLVETSVDDAILDGTVHEALAKPWDDDQLKGLIREGLEIYYRRCGRPH